MGPTDPNAPQPGDPVIFGKFEGLKNTLKPERLGPGDLVRAENVDLDDAGQLRRRRGVTKKVSGDAHSAFTANDGTTLVVLNGALSILRANYTSTVLRTGIADDPSQALPPLAYAQVADLVYFSGATDNGIVNLTTQTASAWGSDPDLWLSPVVNPTPNLPPIAGRLLGKPPLATSLAAWHGRIYMGVGKTLWATELYLYNYVDKTRGYKQFEGELTMVGAVGDGVYVGTDEGVYFLTGPTFDEMKLMRVMDSPVIPGSMVTMPAELGNPPQTGLGVDTPLQVSIAFMTTNGWCVAQDGGETYNLTESKFFFPQAVSAAAMFRRQDGVNQYVAALQSGGDPTSGAAIGDYIEATLIRGAG